MDVKELIDLYLKIFKYAKQNLMDDVLRHVPAEVHTPTWKLISHLLSMVFMNVQRNIDIDEAFLEDIQFHKQTENILNDKIKLTELLEQYYKNEGVKTIFQNYECCQEAKSNKNKNHFIIHEQEMIDSIASRSISSLINCVKVNLEKTTKHYRNVDFVNNCKKMLTVFQKRCKCLTKSTNKKKHDDDYKDNLNNMSSKLLEPDRSQTTVEETCENTDEQPKDIEDEEESDSSKEEEFSDRKKQPVSKEFIDETDDEDNQQPSEHNINNDIDNEEGNDKIVEMEEGNNEEEEDSNNMDISNDTTKEDQKKKKTPSRKRKSPNKVSEDGKKNKIQKREVIKTENKFQLFNDYKTTVIFTETKRKSKNNDKTPKIILDKELIMSTIKSSGNVLGKPVFNVLKTKCRGLDKMLCDYTAYYFLNEICKVKFTSMSYSTKLNNIVSPRYYSNKKIINMFYFMIYMNTMKIIHVCLNSTKRGTGEEILTFVNLCCDNEIFNSPPDGYNRIDLNKYKMYYLINEYGQEPFDKYYTSSEIKLKIRYKFSKSSIKMYSSVILDYFKKLDNNLKLDCNNKDDDYLYNKILDTMYMNKTTIFDDFMYTYALMYDRLRCCYDDGINGWLNNESRYNKLQTMMIEFIKSQSPLKSFVKTMSEEYPKVKISKQLSILNSTFFIEEMEKMIEDVKTKVLSLTEKCMNIKIN